jgi:hypothetical protein
MRPQWVVLLALTLLAIAFGADQLLGRIVRDATQTFSAGWLFALVDAARLLLMFLIGLLNWLQTQGQHRRITGLAMIIIGIPFALLPGVFLGLGAQLPILALETYQSPTQFTVWVSAALIAVGLLEVIGLKRRRWAPTAASSPYQNKPGVRVAD